MSKCSKNQTKTCWAHNQPTKEISEPKSKWFEGYDQIFKTTRYCTSNQSIYGLTLKPKLEFYKTT